MLSRDTCVAKATPLAISHGIAGQTINLNVVPEDIHRLILSELSEASPTDVINVAQSSVTLRDAALPFIYRNITLSTGSKSEEQVAYQALVQNFREDEHGQLARHVRSITVKNEVSSQDLLVILNKVSQHGNLRSLNWETSAHMSDAVFDMIHATWPELKMYVAVVNRPDAKILAHRQMDMRLLSSPLLVGLTCVVYTQGYRPDVPCRSDWPKLSQALAAGGNVRSLRLQSLPDDTGLGLDGIKLVPDTEPEKLPRLDLAGLRLPQLEELTIESLQHWGGSTYFWDMDYARMFRMSIDCSRLRKLDFGSDNPTAFFTSFTGLCPKLKTLSFGMTVNNADTEPAKRFIASLDALEHLDVSQAQQGIDDLWPAIEKHKDTLQTLVLGPTLGSYCSPIYMDSNLLETIALTFPKLERLGWDAPCTTDIDAEHLKILSSMKLKKLDLYLHIPDEASNYSDKLVQNPFGSIAPPELDKQRSITAAINIAEILSESQQDTLQWLTLRISRTGYSDRYQPWMMHTKLQLRRDNHAGHTRRQKWDVRGKMDWYCLPPLEEDLLFEDE